MKRYDVIVVGSGPGGSVTARACAERGLRVLVLEEGSWVPPSSFPDYTLHQMRHQYRNAGLTVSIGRPPVAYSEGRCAGGGSEVNAGLYHRPGPDLLRRWSRQYSIEGLDEADLAPHSEVVEARLGVSTRHAELPPASALLRRGAEALGWRGMDVPRWVRNGHKQTMTRTYLADALAAGCELRAATRVLRVLSSGGRATGVLTERDGCREEVRSEHVVLCAGATQTPALMARSGLGNHRVGSGLSMHPTVKVVAETEDVVTDPCQVPSYQVREFHPDLTLGGSASGQPLVALALADTAGGADVAEWRRLPVYYAAVRGRGKGRVTVLPGFGDPLVTYSVSREDLALLRSGLGRLMHLLLAAGAVAVRPSYVGAPVVSRARDVGPAAERLTRSSASLMTVHLCGSVGMGEDRRRCGADSFGRVHGAVNLRVNDASLLPDAPGINPQGTVMAIAQRNVAALLEESW